MVTRSGMELWGMKVDYGHVKKKKAKNLRSAFILRILNFSIELMFVCFCLKVRKKHCGTVEIKINFS